jgi:predicted transcriptional regulator
MELGNLLDVSVLRVGITRYIVNFLILPDIVFLSSMINQKYDFNLNECGTAKKNKS